MSTIRSSSFCPRSRTWCIRGQFFKYARKLKYLFCGEFFKRCNNILFFESILVIFDVVGSFGSMLTEWICYTLFCTVCGLNGFMYYRCYTQNIATVLHYVIVQHNAQEPAYQCFIFIPLPNIVFYNTIYIFCQQLHCNILQLLIITLYIFHRKP